MQYTSLSGWWSSPGHPGELEEIYCCRRGCTPRGEYRPVITIQASDRKILSDGLQLHSPALGIGEKRVHGVLEIFHIGSGKGPSDDEDCHQIGLLAPGPLIVGRERHNVIHGSLESDTKANREYSPLGCNVPCSVYQCVY
eukprot:993477-Pyramimonas_sp.AAC.1